MYDYLSEYETLHLVVTMCVNMMYAVTMRANTNTVYGNATVRSVAGWWLLCLLTLLYASFFFGNLLLRWRKGAGTMNSKLLMLAGVVVSHKIRS